MPCISKSVWQHFPKAALTLKVRDGEDVTWEVTGHRESSSGPPRIPLREIRRWGLIKLRVECLSRRNELVKKETSYCFVTVSGGKRDTFLQQVSQKLSPLFEILKYSAESSWAKKNDSNFRYAACVLRIYHFKHVRSSCHSKLWYCLLSSEIFAHTISTA